MASTTRLGMLCSRQLRQPVTRALFRPEQLRQSSLIARRIAPFSTTSTRKILPPGPQVIHGGVNDPAPVPEPQYVLSGEDDVLKIWFTPVNTISLEAWLHIRSDRASTPSSCERTLTDYSPTHGSYHWIAERAISVGLIPLTLAPFAAGSLNPTMDAILITGLVLHTHIGFQAVVIDYIPTWQHPRWRTAFEWLLLLATGIVGVGLYEFETNDVGLTEAIKRIWRAGSANDATIGKVQQLTNVN